MPFYNIKPVEDLTNLEILIILDLWNIDAWKFMEPSEFKSRFRESEIHFLKDEKDNILCIARISFNFILKISGADYYYTEFAGLASAQKHRGFGLILIEYIIENMQQRNLDSVGFCDKKLRPFYEKSGATLIHDAAGFIFQQADGELVKSSLDDIIVVNLRDSHFQQLAGLNEQNIAILILQDQEL